MIKFKTKDGKEKEGTLVRQYKAFEGDMRYIFKEKESGAEYRCSKTQEGKYIEYVA